MDQKKENCCMETSQEESCACGTTGSDNTESCACGTTDSDNKKSCCWAGEEAGDKTTIRSVDNKRKMINRLRRIQGQVRGLEAMIEKDAYCNDILQQSAAVNAAINAFNRELIANHMRSCVARDIREGKEEVIDELVATLQKLMK